MIKKTKIDLLIQILDSKNPNKIDTKNLENSRVVQYFSGETKTLVLVAHQYYIDNTVLLEIQWGTVSMGIFENIEDALLILKNNKLIDAKDAHILESGY